MALDPSIILQGKVPSLSTALAQGGQQAMRGASVFEELKNAPLKRQQLEADLQATQLRNQAMQGQIAEDEQDREIFSMARGALDLLPELSANNFKGVIGKLEKRAEMLADEGVDEKGMEDTLQMIEAFSSDDPEVIMQAKSDMVKAIDLAEARGLIDLDTGAVDERFSPTTTTLPNGTTIQTTSTGRKVVTDVSGNVLTGDDARKAIEEAASFGIEEQGRRAGARVRSQELEKQRQGFVKQGLSARGLIKDTKRLLELNELITTGKTAAARKAFGDLFGVTDPNLGEFNSKAGQLVLGQIRQLGANPTEGERAFLEQITPSIEQGGAVNRALLNDLLDMQQRQVDRAKWLAKNPDRTVEDYLLETDTDDFEGSSGVDAPRGTPSQEAPAKRRRYNPETGRIE